MKILEINLRYKNKNIMNTTILGLDKKQTEELTNELNALLANFQTYYQS